jgi:hypothetical protein
MDWIRRRPRLAVAAGVVATVVVLAIVVLLVRQPNEPAQDPTPIALPTNTPTATPLKTLPTTVPSASPSTAAQAKAATQKAFNAFGKGLSSGSGSTSFNMPGIQGGSQFSFLPKHRVTMRVSSREPIAYVGWVVPTAYPKIRDIVKNVGTSWSLTLTAYGDPDYAQVYVQANPSGAPITCTITVDGRVTQRESTEGPYGRLYPCQG